MTASVQTRMRLKLNIRNLKNTGLTNGHEAGHEISCPGKAALTLLST